MENKLEEKKLSKSSKTVKENDNLADLTETLQRLQADFENYKKRAEKERGELAKILACQFIVKLLPVLDTFEIALKNSQDKEKFVEGIKLAYAQFHSLLEGEGLKPTPAVGCRFDPCVHEVMLREHQDKEDGLILEEFQKGYLVGDRVVRTSKVKVNVRQETSCQENSQTEQAPVKNYDVTGGKQK
ncbi:MAG TPA: nucleotide exchange factor GrpE [Candidatus Nanoarchaeia archaeon]|nr:nucleotide exchange factor GrpE [Candidatus Nanoarchaeia archaeon]